MSTEESSLAGSEGWSFDGGMVDTLKVGSDKVGLVRAEMSSDATGWEQDWEHCQG